MIKKDKLSERELKILDKVRNGDVLEDEEVSDLRDIACEHDNEWHEFTIDTDRWTSFCHGVFNLDGQWYSICYQLGLTEYQIDVYEAQCAKKIEVTTGYIKAVSFGGSVVTEGSVMSESELKQHLHV